MGKVIAIGGMTNGINDIKTICGAIINECKKENPRLLYVPTANKDHPGYSEFMTNFFEKNYSCDVDTLWLINNPINERQIREKILNTDIVFTEGGNLILLLEIWN